jgi:hypothetical protein
MVEESRTATKSTTQELSLVVVTETLGVVLEPLAPLLAPTKSVWSVPVKERTCVQVFSISAANVITTSPVPVEGAARDQISTRRRCPPTEPKFTTSCARFSEVFHVMLEITTIGPLLKDQMATKSPTSLPVMVCEIVIVVASKVASVVAVSNPIPPQQGRTGKRAIAAVKKR